MANGYLGKISAIVSANTADFDSKLSKSAAEVRKFAGSMDGTLRSAQSGAGTSLRGIYTDAQKLQRALSAVSTQKLNFSGFKGLNLAEAVTQLQAVYSVSQQIGKPLAGAAKTMSGLSAGVQAEFLPAMIRAQTATETLSEVIDRTGSAGVRHFQSVEKQVDRTVAAMRRMNETNTMVSGIATGQELRFQRPELSAEMQRTAALQSQAAQMSPAAVSSNGVSSLVAQQRAAALETERLAAALERESLLINGNVAEATTAYQAQLAVQRRVNDEVERRIRLEASVGARTDISDVGRSSPFVNPLVGSRTDISDVGRSSSLEERRRSLARTSMGEDVYAPRRQLGVLEGGITSLKSQIDQLPEPMRRRFVPAIREAEQEFIRLKAAASPVAGDIEAARARLANLTKEATRASQAMKFRESFGGAGRDGVNLGLDQRAIRGYEGSLGALQTALGRTSAQARGPAVAAFNDLRNAISDAMDQGNLSMPATQRNIQRLTNVAINATSRAGGGSVGTIQRDMQRAGDIGRGGFDNLSLAANQAAFAIDDFMSSTGGIDQKLRAVSNNVTQLAFVLGGTKGLWIGLGAILAGQVAVGLVKYINGGRTAEDQTKALNDSLARQKSLVEDLAQAFKSLADSMSEGTFSDVGKKSSDFNRQIEDIKKKQTDSRKERVSYIDPDVQRERAEQNRLTREMEKTTDPGLRAAQAASLRESKEREKKAMEAAAERAAAGATPDDIRRVAGGTVRETEFLEGGRLTRRSREQAEERRAQLENDVAAAGTDPIEMEKVIQQRINERNVTARQDIGPLNLEEGPEILRAREDVLQLERLLASLQDPIRAAIDLAANEIADSSRGPAEDIRNAQEEVAEAIKEGIPGARLFGLELDKNAQGLEDAYRNLEKAAEEEDPKKKKELVDKAQAGIDDLQARRAKIETQADALRYERTVDSQRQMDARAERVGANLSDAGLQSGQIARRMREIENQRETIRQQASKEENQNPMAQRLFEQSEAALNAEVAAIEAATIAVKTFSQALDKASEEAKSNLNSSQQAADEARRADLGNSTPQTQLDRKRAEDDLERQRQLEREAQTEIAVQRDRQEQMAASPEAVRLQQINENLASGTNPEQEKERMMARRGEVSAEVDAANAAEGEAVAKSKEKFRVMNEAAGAVLDTYIKAQELGISSVGGPRGIIERMRNAGNGKVADDLQREMDRTTAAAEPFGGIPYGDTGQARREADAEEIAAINRQKAVVAKGAKRLAAIDAEIAAAPEGDREALIRERDAIQADMEDKARASQESVNAKRDASTREDEQRKSAARGAEMARTPEEKFAADTDAGMSDIKNYYERRAEANGGLRPAGDAEAQAEAERRFREDREKEARTATMAGRGRESFMTDRERFSRDSREGIVKDMTAGAIDQAGLMNVQGRRALLEKGIQNQMEQVAPMLASFEEERQNARLQGPSRAALNMSDVSTSQGASELNRLLRGDDSAKDVNLAELRKQNDNLQTIADLLREANPGVLL